MKNLEEVAQTIKDETLDGRFNKRLTQFIPSNMLEKFSLKLMDDVSPEKWDSHVIPFTRENVLKQLKEDVAFGFKKALDCRGISASLMFNVVLNWNKILEEGLENWDENNYAQYGLPLFKATAVKYGWDNPIGDDEGDEPCYSEEWYFGY